MIKSPVWELGWDEMRGSDDKGRVVMIAKGLTALDSLDGRDGPGGA